MADIVERLRNPTFFLSRQDDEPGVVDLHPVKALEDMSIAADEIERLRTEVVDLKAELAEVDYQKLIS